MGILISHDPSSKLPKIGSNVFIQNAHKHSSSYVVCKESVINGDFTNPPKSYNFTNFIKMHKLGIADLIIIDENREIFEKKFAELENCLKQTLLLSVVETILLAGSARAEKHVCRNKRIIGLKLVSISSCRHVNINSNKYNDFPYWSFGINYKPTKNTLLFGFFIIQPKYGLLMLKDSLYQMVCLVVNATNKNMSSLINRYVIIKNYKVITEIFKENDVPNIEYILVDFIDIIQLQTAQPDYPCMFGNSDDIPRCRKFRNYIGFTLIRKSLTCIGNSNQPECWFEILITSRNGEVISEMAFLILPSEFIRLIAHFRDKYSYKLYHEYQLKETKNIELSRIAAYKIYEIRDKDVYFQNTSAVENEERYLSVKECKQYVANNTNLVSFEGILKCKRFANSLSSRTAKRTLCYGFGTPGSRIHQLVFSCTENDTELYLDCYLNNWENILMPLGLIPQMRIRVKNVLPQSRKYVKATIFTSFEVVSYEPAVAFQTANLFENHTLDWGPRFFLGHGNTIPYGVIIWGIVFSVQVLSVKMTNKCKGCKSLCDRPGPCMECQAEEKEIDLLITMHVSDEFGQSKVITKDAGLLRTILDLGEKHFQVWMKAFEEIGEYKFSLFEENAFAPVSDTNVFRNALSEYLMTINTCATLNLHLKCRKLDSNPQKNGGRPLWFCVDARR